MRNTVISALLPCAALYIAILTGCNRANPAQPQQAPACESAAPWAHGRQGIKLKPIRRHAPGQANSHCTRAKPLPPVQLTGGGGRSIIEA